MSWFGETHGTKFELIRLFAGRMLDGEWSSTPGQWQNVVIGAFAMLVPAGVLLIREGTLEAGKYRQLSMLEQAGAFRAAAFADELALLTLVLSVTGLLALIQWQSLFPGRRDYLVLAGLPVQSRQIFVARFATVLLFSTALVVAMNLLPSLIAPVEFGGRWQKNPSLLINIVAQLVASGLGCFFVLFALIALQGVLLNTLSGRLFARISVYAQSGLIGTLFLAALYSWSIRDWGPGTIAKLPDFAAWAPPLWFAGLHEYLLGDADPFFGQMAGRAVMAVLSAVALAIVTYVVSYRRYAVLLLETPVHVDVPRKRQWSAIRLLARTPRQEAVMEFMAKTLVRSRAHRVIWLAYIGAGLGIVINSSLLNDAVRPESWTRAMNFMVLCWPLASAVVLLTGLRHVLRIPAELPANWIFRITESQGRKEWMQAVERFVLLYTIIPIYLIQFPVSIYLSGWSLAARMTVLQVIVSLTVFDLLFNGWQQLPFTCTYVPGKRPLIAIVAGYIWVLGAMVPVVSMWISAGSSFKEIFPLYFVMFASVWFWARRQRRSGWGAAILQYEDLSGSVLDLGIKEMTYRGAGITTSRP